MRYSGIVFFFWAILLEETVAELIFSDDQPKDHCKDPPERGTNCRESNTMWYFQPTTKTCLQTDYPVCSGVNAFPEEDVCLQTCNPEAFMDYENIGDDRCTQPLDNGKLCENKDPPPDEKWRYDRESNTCAPFTHLGCGAPSYFNTSNECQEACLQDTNDVEQDGSTESPCNGPLKRGNRCRGTGKRREGRRQMWYFNETSNTCREFTYRGCGGGQNMHSDQNACREKCKPSKQK
ncbi:papilin-like [Dermacentor silvarum]|uniref:papilin-like n=1 Tax=Dermacentor silvarum TaxID=543639 RepID=UPI002100CA5D|nr:papilin-like [Dermacentor silvarum]